MRFSVFLSMFLGCLSYVVIVERTYRIEPKDISFTKFSTCFFLSFLYFVLNKNSWTHGAVRAAHITNLSFSGSW